MPNAEKQHGRNGGMPLTWVSTHWLKPRVAALGRAVGLHLFVPRWWQRMPAEIGGWGWGTSGGSSVASPGILRALITSGPRGSRARWSSPPSAFSLAICRASIPTTGCSCCSLPLWWHCCLWQFSGGLPSNYHTVSAFFIQFQKKKRSVKGGRRPLTTV